MISRMLMVGILLAMSGGSDFARADTIDSILQEEYDLRKMKVAGRCSDELFLRRITLDLAGRIPTLEEIDAFRSSPDREAKIEQLLSSPEFASSWSEIWTANWIGYRQDFGTDRELLRQWIEQSIRDQKPYDVMVHDVIAAKGVSTLDGNTLFMLRNQEEPAVRVSRAFLGVRLDCARCHDHPFDRWKQENYEEFSRFFRGMRTRQVADRATELFDDVELTKRVDESERPKFLTNAVPKTSLWRNELGVFVTKSKPFARAYANRVWYQLLGRGIFDPPDDLSDANQPVSRKLLEFLAEKAREQRFDIRAMVRMICRSDAYQRDSIGIERSNEAVALFAVRALKPMTAEQSIDSMGIAIGKGWTLQERNDFVRDTIGTNAEDDFSSHWEYRETVQGLMMRLTENIRAPSGSLDELFLRALTRLPNDDERRICQSQKPDEVAFALVSSDEFFFQH